MLYDFKYTDYYSYKIVLCCIKVKCLFWEWDERIDLKGVEGNYSKRWVLFCIFIEIWMIWV